MNISNLKNVFWHKHYIDKKLRIMRNQHNAFVLWFTGLSGSGKSTIAGFLEHLLYQKKINTYLLDGDNIRTGLCKDLSFNIADRQENIRRVAEVAKLMVDAGLLVLVTLISPYQKHRDQAKNIIGKKNFLEIFVNTPINICKERDPKNLYLKSLKGEINDFTGIQEEYESPDSPDYNIDGTESLDKISKKLLKFLYKRLIT
ncbi:adenylyl-sulfate kinase [Buchnera aphidicola (Thelaxes californica)]|uniref:Adenylyl-sulfate kinase n=1 Tax=Buchnera aphidicola (Thelaxes californica) TaxID=1315998 RepID=A0A4D6YM92_9GAMM|nr:adenylyl-sulfate kinase [Buchnera aphidicola]QCI26848.1 adenylyl-sulfate kinase [Buchnera aphidicola (Thelaxes californica)]